MKLLKLFPAALAVFALASCSTEEIESSKVEEQNCSNKGDLRITFDPFDDELTTRAYADNKFNADFGAPTFEDGENVYVYDEDMHATDVYSFNQEQNAFYFAPQFEGDEKQIKTNPSYAVYAGNVTKAPKGYVLRTEPGTPTCVDINIPKVLTYKQTATRLEGKTLYGFDIPAFGKASYNTDESDPYLKAEDFRYLTALLRIKLTNAFGNVSYLKLSNKNKPLSGQLMAKLYTGKDRVKAKLELEDEDYLGKITYKEIYIDLRNVPSDVNYIYIPVVPGLDGDEDDIKLEYTANRTENDPEKIAPAEWSTLPGMTFPGTTFEAHKRYAGKATFELTDMCPKKISDMLAQYSASGTDIILNLTNKFSINAADKNIDNVIYLPKFDKEDMMVTINLVAPFTAFDNTASDALIVKNVSDDNPTNAKVILNLGTITPDADKLNLTIDAPGADLQAIGDFSNQTKLELLNAAKFTIGDGTNATDFTKLTTINWGDKDKGVKEIIIEDKAEVKAVAPVVLGNNSKSTVTEKFTVNGKLDVTGNNILIGGENMKQFIVGDNGEIIASMISGYWGKQLEKIEIAGDVQAGVNGALNYKTDVIVKGDNGKVTGNVTMYNVASNITVEGKGQIVGNINAAVSGKEVKKGVITITSETDKAVSGDVSTMGDVNIAMGAEGEAITGKLNMLGANKTLNLTQGYINEVNVKVSNTGTWEDNKITIDLDGFSTYTPGLATYTPGLAAFKTLTIALNNSVDYTESVWDGKLITNAGYKAVKTKVTYGTTDLTSQAIFTASQLATIGSTDAIRLFNNFDLKDKDTWEGITLSTGLDCMKIVPGETTGSIADEVRTVKNLNISKTGVKGFINTLSGTSGVKNLTINGVKDTKSVSSAVSGTGALIGANTKSCTIDNVTVSGISFGATGQFSSVGGIIGNNKANVVLNKCTVSGSIQGYAGLGGLIGSTSADVVATACDASGISFKQAYDSEKAMDINYARVGGFIGTVQGTSVSVNLSGKAPEALAAAPADLKSGKCFVSNESESTGNFYTYTASQNFIGFSGNKNASTPNSIKDYAMINGTRYCNNANFAATAVAHDHGISLPCNYLCTWPAKTISARKR